MRNAALVMERISGLLRDDPNLPLSQGLIAEIHAMVTADIDYADNSPGIYRSHGVRAGEYSPPSDHDEIVRLMGEFEGWLLGPEATHWPPIVRAVAAHFYFISIHPFGDGNGRTARAIESFLLYQAKVNVLGFYSLSNFYYRKRPEYIEHLDAVRFRSGNDLTPFVAFALSGLVEELEAVHKEVLDAVAEIAFRVFASEHLLEDQRLERKVRERTYKLLVALMQPVLISDIREGKHAISGLYASLSDKTFVRDLRLLEKRNLIVVTRGEAHANLAVMRDFMA